MATASQTMRAANAVVHITMAKMKTEAASNMAQRKTKAIRCAGSAGTAWSS
jgi:hypothetical protein